jgi:hypothetical protein
VPSRPTLPDEIGNHGKRLRDRGSNFDNRAGETFDAADTRTTEIHLEASPPAAGRYASFASYPPPSERPNFVPASPPQPLNKFGRAEISSDTLSEEPASLFGDALPSISTPLDRLRLELREVLSRRRGTQSRLAEAVGLARPTFSNALSGRERFTPTAAAALRRWLDGEPVAGNWPPFPPGAEEQDAA